MSDFYKSTGNVSQYIEFEAKEMSSAQYVFGMKSIAADACYNQLAHYYNEIGDYIKAIDYGTMALECDSIQFGVENKEYPVYVSTLGNLTQFYQNAHNDIEVLNCKKKCIGIWKQMENEDNYLKEIHTLLFTGCDMIGIAKRIKIVENEFKALPNFVNANSIHIANILKQMALYYWMIDDNKSAIKSCDTALAIYKMNDNVNNEEYAELLSSKCKYQRFEKLGSEAIETGEKAKQIYDSLKIKPLRYAELMGDLSWAYGLLYNYERSIQLQNISLDIYEKAKDWLSLAEAYNSISDYYQRAEKLESAEQNIKKAILVLQDHDDVNQIISVDVERLSDSSIVTPFALSKIKERLDYDKISFYQALARIYQKEGKIKDAIATEKENLLLLRDIKDNRSYALHLMTLAQYYLLDKQLNNSKECIEQAFQIDDGQFSIANGKAMLSSVCFEMGDTLKAIQLAKESFSLYNTIRDAENVITAEWALSRLYWKCNDYSKAELYMSKALDLLKSKICKEFTGMISEQKQRIWAIYEKFFIFYRHIIEKSDRNADLLSKLYDYILFSKSLLLDSEIQQNNNNISRLNIKWKDIQKHLPNDAIAIEFISTWEEEGGYNTYHALVIDKKSPSPKMITLYRESKLEEKKGAETRNISDIVGELIWKPVLDQFVTVKDIYFSPDGILHMLPIEYYSEDGTNSMFEKYDMYRLSSTKELIREPENRSPNSAVLYGGLDYNQLKETVSKTNTSEMSSMWRGIADRGGFDPLFNTALETQEIKELLTDKNISTVLYSGENGTEKSFRNLSGKNHSIIHLATHGMYINPDDVDIKKKESNFDFLESLASLNDPVKEDVTLTHSFLVMAGGNRVIARIPVFDTNNDGILTSKEISQLDLRGLDLVVLSACESALGDITNGGVYGLQRGFKKGGANTIVMSLDKVDDEATRILMVEFYRNLMNGKTKRQSLKEAQQYLRKIDNGKYDKPKNWASFIMLDGLN